MTKRTPRAGPYDGKWSVRRFPRQLFLQVSFVKLWGFKSSQWLSENAGGFSLRFEAQKWSKFNQGHEDSLNEWEQFKATSKSVMNESYFAAYADIFPQQS